MEDTIKILDAAEKAIGTLMLEVNRLNNEILLKDKKINDLQEHNVNLVDDLFAERKEVLKFEAEIEALKEELKRYADAIGEERGNKALRNNEIGKILTKIFDDCGLLKKASDK